MQDKFYILKPAVDTEETGHVFPAVESFEDYDFKASDSVYNLASDSFPEFTPNIRFKLAKGAKLCDIMGQATISTSGLLISARLKELLSNFKITPHKYYHATIEENQNSFQYYWIHLVWEEGINHLNFERSKFKIKKISRDLGDVSISNYTDLLEKQGELGFIKMIHNYYTVLDDVAYDLFIHPLNKTIYANQKLIEEISSYNITGKNMQEANNLLVSQSEIN